MSYEELERAMHLNFNTMSYGEGYATRSNQKWTDSRMKNSLYC